MASDFDTMNAARSSKWDSSAPGNVLSISPKLSTPSSTTDKLDMYSLKEDSGEKSKTESKTNKSLGDTRQFPISSHNNTIPNLSTYAMLLSGMNYNGLPPNFSDNAVTYLNPFGIPRFPHLPLQFNPNNIAVASVMPNALETLVAAQLGGVLPSPSTPSPHTPSVSPSDFSPFAGSLRPPGMPFPTDYEQQLEYLSRLYGPPINALNPFLSQDAQTFSQLSSASKSQSTTSDKSRKETTSDIVYRPKGVGDKLKSMQNGGDILKRESKSRHATNTKNVLSTSAIGHLKAMRTVNLPQAPNLQKINKIKTNAAKDQIPTKDHKAKPQVPHSTNKKHISRPVGNQDNCKAVDKSQHLNKICQNTGAISHNLTRKKTTDFGAEEAAAILLNLSHGAENDSNQERKERCILPNGAQQPIDYSQSSAHIKIAKEHQNNKSKNNSKVTTVASSPHTIKQTVINKPKSCNNNGTNIEQLKTKPVRKSTDSFGTGHCDHGKVSLEKSSIVNEIDDDAFEVGTEESKLQAGGFNFKKHICKKFTSESDPLDLIKDCNQENAPVTTRDHKHDLVAVVCDEPKQKHLANDKNINLHSVLKSDMTNPDKISAVVVNHAPHVNNIPTYKSANLNSSTLKADKNHVVKHKDQIHAQKNSIKRLNKHNKSEYKTKMMDKMHHHSAQSFSDLRAISKHFHDNGNNKVLSNRANAKGLYRDAFGGSSDSLESLGEESGKEDKEDESESESDSDDYSSSCDSDKNNETDGSESEDVSEIGINKSENSSTTNSLKRPFSLSRPKFTLAKSKFSITDSPVPSKEDENLSKVTIRSPTFTFSRKNNKEEDVTAENEVCEKNKSLNNLSKSRMKVMPRASANTLPKPRIVARVSKVHAKPIVSSSMPELKLEESATKSSLKSLFVKALNKSGETGGRPVGIPVDHKSLRAIGFGNTSYILHNNKKYILRRALARKKVISKKFDKSNLDEISKPTAKKQRKIVDGSDENNNTVDNVSIKPTIENKNRTCIDKSKTNTSSFSSKQPNHSANVDHQRIKIIKKDKKRRKQSNLFLPVLQCPDDSDIFSKVKLRHRTSLHNLSKDNVNNSSNNSNQTTAQPVSTHHARKKQWPRNSKRVCKSVSDNLLLTHISYNRSIARAKRFYQKRHESLRRSSLIKTDEKRAPQCVRIMAGSRRPSYQVLRKEIREVKDADKISRKLQTTSENHDILSSKQPDESLEKTNVSKLPLNNTVTSDCYLLKMSMQNNNKDTLDVLQPQNSRQRKENSMFEQTKNNPLRDPHSAILPPDYSMESTSNDQVNSINIIETTKSKLPNEINNTQSCTYINNINFTDNVDECDVKQKNNDILEDNNSATKYKHDCNQNANIDTAVPVIAGSIEMSTLTSLNDNPVEKSKPYKSRRKLMSRPWMLNTKQTSNASLNSFKLMSMFSGPPSLCLGPGIGDLTPSFSLAANAQYSTKSTKPSPTLKSWKHGEDATEVKQQQQRDCWKNMTLNTYTFN